MKQWFNVDKQGLGRQAEEQGKGRLVGELIQNALDEPGVTQIAVNLALVPGQDLADLSVEDDAPAGFADLRHSYTLFAPSAKRGNPEQRGQFNLGEKLVLAVCEQASISTTKGTVIFDPEQGRIEKPDQQRERGRVITIAHSDADQKPQELRTVRIQILRLLCSLLCFAGLTLTEVSFGQLFKDRERPAE